MTWLNGTLNDISVESSVSFSDDESNQTSEESLMDT